MDLLIEKCINHYLEYKNSCISSEVLDFKRMSLGKAIKLAAMATNEQGTKFSHQRRLSDEPLKTSFKILSACENEIGVIKSFDNLIQFIEKKLASIHGLGELYFYDTALRIGASLKLFPDKVYLHSGTRLGGIALGLASKGQKTISPKDIPTIFTSKLNIYEIEDVLCIYKSCFKSGKFEITSSMEKCCLK